MMLLPLIDAYFFAAAATPLPLLLFSSRDATAIITITP